MKKILLSIFALLALISPSIVKAASWTMSVAGDTVYATVDSNAVIYDRLVLTGSGTVTINWNVVTGTNFPSDWLTQAAFGICDNSQCYNNTGGTYVWNPGTSTGTTFTSQPYSAGDGGDFHMALNLKGCTPGTHVVRVQLADNSLNSKTVTFIITKPMVNSVQQVTAADQNISLYPNPANNEVNVVYDENADVKNIAIYNIIGKMMTVYKVAGNSANMSLEGMPSGIYFLKLYNSKGNVVVTRKFTKQ